LVKEIRIYMEGAGAKDRTNSARLSEGMRQFLSRVWEEARTRRVKLRLITSGPREAAYDAFSIAQRQHLDAYNVLLVDSEGPVEGTPSEHLAETEGWDLSGASADQVHLMVQSMEAWLVADSDSIARFYGKGFTASAVPKTKNVETIAKDDLVPALKRATRGTKKGEYHKTRHAFDLLAQIDPAKVRSRAPHCERLFQTLLDHLAS
jgi:hypothetical protein